MASHPSPRLACPLALAVMLISAPHARAGRQTESLGRGVVAIPTEAGGVFVGWRLLTTDPPHAAFNVYCSRGEAEPTRLNPQPLRDATHFIDDQTKPDAQRRYTVRAVIEDREQAA